MSNVEIKNSIHEIPKDGLWYQLDNDDTINELHCLKWNSEVEKFQYMVIDENEEVICSGYLGVIDDVAEFLKCGEKH